MCQKCESICGLWVLNQTLKEIYTENINKIAGAVWELSAKKAQPIQSISTQIGLDWLCYLAGNSQTAHMLVF